MRILHIGDIVGKPGERIVRRGLKAIREKEHLDFVIANAENAEDGSGLRCNVYKKFIACGIDAITMGDHIYRKKEIIDVLNTKQNIVKPANYAPDAPGNPWVVVESKAGVKVAVISLMGRVFMRPVDCPFIAADRVLAEVPEDVKVRMIDFHAEATSDKQLLGRRLDGKVTAVLGTHTHVATADEQIFPGGTAFQCDIGMTGPYQSILGRKIDPVMKTTVTFEPTSFQVATGDVRISGTIVEVDERTGKATDIQRYQITQAEVEELTPDFDPSKM